MQTELVATFVSQKLLARVEGVMERLLCVIPNARM